MLVQDLAPLGRVHGAALAHEQVGGDRVLHVALVLELVRHVRAVEEVVGIEERGLRAEGHRLVLAVERGRDVGSVLLLVRLGVDAHVLEVLQDELELVHHDRGAVGRVADGGREAVREARLGEELLGPGRIVLVVLRALAELVDGQRPFLEPQRHRGVQGADALEGGVDDALAVQRHRDRPPHPHVAERRLVGAHVDVAHLVGGVLGRLQPRALLLHHVLELHPVDPVDGARVLPADVVLARDERGHPGGVVLVHRDLDPVDVGQAALVVGRVADERHPDVGAVAVHHPRPGADHRLPLLQVAELLHALLGHDADRHRVDEHVEEPGEGLLEDDAHRVLVGRLHAVHRGQHVAVGVALLVDEAIEAVLDVVGRHLAAVDRGLVVPAHAAAELEDVGGVVGLRPGLGEVALELEHARRDRGARLVPEQPAVREGVQDVRLVRDRELRIPVGRIPEAEAQGAAPLRGLGSRDGRGAQDGGGPSAELEKVTAAQRETGMVRRHP